MLGVFLAFLVSILESFKDVYAKLILKDTNPQSLVMYMKLISCILLLPFVNLGSMDTYAWKLVLSGGLLNALAFWLYFKAIKCGEVSLVVPMLSLSSVFLVATSYIMLGEWVGSFGLLGVLLVFLGVFVISVSERRIVLMNRCVSYMLAVAFIWSITANIDKLGVFKLGYVSWVFMINFSIFVFLLIIFPRYVVSFKRSYVSMAILDTLSALLQMVAIMLTLVPFVISIKRLSILHSIILSRYFLQEHVSVRLVGAILMLAGTFMILLQLYN